MSEKSHSEISIIQNQYKEFINKTNEKCSLSKVVFNEDSKLEKTTLARDDVGLDWVYTIQHQVALRWYMKFLAHHPNLLDLDDDIFACLDIGSQADFVSIMASFTNYIHLDPNLNLSSEDVSTVLDTNMAFQAGEAQNIPFDDNSFKWITSLHAIEHFGLGRYGDSIDPLGDIKGLKEISRVCNLDGWFLGSVPITRSGEERIVFNKNRIYSITKIRSMLEDCGFSIQRELCVISPTINCDTGTPLKSIFSTKEFEAIMCQYTFDSENHDAVYIWLARNERQ